jgi:hypothetical protein
MAAVTKTNDVEDSGGRFCNGLPESLPRDRWESSSGVRVSGDMSPPPSNDSPTGSGFHSLPFSFGDSFRSSLGLPIVRTAASPRRIIGMEVMLDWAAHALNAVLSLRSRKTFALRNVARFVTRRVTKARRDQSEQSTARHCDPKFPFRHMNPPFFGTCSPPKSNAKIILQKRNFFCTMFSPKHRCDSHRPPIGLPSGLNRAPIGLESNSIRPPSSRHIPPILFCLALPSTLWNPL